MDYPDFTFEHVALNVRDLEPAVRWYEENLHLRAARHKPGAVAFLADPSGRLVFELYQNESAAMLPLSDQHPLTLHIAFLVGDIAAQAERLVSAGATVVDPRKDAAGDELLMLRDPFGLCIQLVRRRTPMMG